MTSTQRIASLLLSLLICTSLYAGLNKAAPKGEAKKAAKLAKKAAPKKIEFAPAPVPERFLASCYSKGIVVIVGKDGKIEREIKGVSSAQDSWMLKNGNVLYSYIHGAREVDPQGKVVWEYKTAKPKATEIHSAQPLPNGNVLIAESGQGRILEINRKGEIAKEIAVKTKEKSKHMQFRSCRKTKRGTYLIGCFGDGVILELDGAGKVLRRLVPVPDKNGKPKRGGAHGVVELPNGNLLISTGYGQRFVEMDPKGKIVWTLSQADMPKDFRLAYACSIQQQANGNRVIATYRGMPQFFAVTPDKKVIWSYNNKSLANISGIVVLDDKGDPAKGEVLR
jgi:hypothetical protein